MKKKLTDEQETRNNKCLECLKYKEQAMLKDEEATVLIQKWANCGYTDRITSNGRAGRDVLLRAIEKYKAYQPAK
ncbi:MAG TPA: hypothetical protein PKA10_14920 [Selenomonadales bacterium]|nr:hypothetical protein [Selenomonadales bacterium]